MVGTAGNWGFMSHLRVRAIQGSGRWADTGDGAGPWKAHVASESGHSIPEAERFWRGK